MRRQFLEHDWFPKPLPPNVEIGSRSWVYSAFAFIHYHSQQPLGVRIGNDTGIYHGTFFDLGPHAEVVVGDWCSLVGVIIATDGRIEIGDYALLAHEVVIADHAAAVPSGNPGIAATADRRTDIRIGRNVWIGARAVVLGGSSIGDDAIVGAGAVVAGSVPPASIFAGNPARMVGTLRRTLA